MKTSFSLFLSTALVFATLSTAAFGESRKDENSAKRTSSGHHSQSHHKSSGSHRSTNSGSKTHTNVPSN